MEEKELDQLICRIMDLGAEMICAGAEINRVEDTMRRAGIAYGAVKTEIFAINSCIFATMEFDGGKEFTHTRRIIKGDNTDFLKLEQLNQLSRLACDGRLTPCEFALGLEKIKKRRAAAVKFVLGSVLAAAGFTLFFSGSLADSAVAAVFALFICLLQKFAVPVCPNKVFFNFISSLAVGLAVCFTVKLIPGLHIDKILIGDIMLLIPGLALTNSVRNILVGDTVSGTMKLIESLLWAGALTAGFMLSMILAGGGLL